MNPGVLLLPFCVVFCFVCFCFVLCFVARFASPRFGHGHGHGHGLQAKYIVNHANAATPPPTAAVATMHNIASIACPTQGGGGGGAGAGARGGPY